MRKVAWELYLYLLNGWFLLVFLTILYQLEIKNDNDYNNKRPVDGAEE